MKIYFSIEWKLGLLEILFLKVKEKLRKIIILHGLRIIACLVKKAKKKFKACLLNFFRILN